MDADISPLELLTEAKDAIEMVIAQDMRLRPETLAVLYEFLIALHLEVRDADPGPVY